MRVLPWAALCLLAIAAVEWTVPDALYRLLPGKNASYDRMKHLKIVVSAPTSYDILFLGDSTAKNAVIPSLFQTETGKTSYNLGI